MSLNADHEFAITKFLHLGALITETYLVEPRFPRTAGDLRPCCSAAEVRTAVAAVFKVGGLLTGEPRRDPAGELAPAGREPVCAGTKKVHHKYQGALPRRTPSRVAPPPTPPETTTKILRS